MGRFSVQIIVPLIVAFYLAGSAFARTEPQDVAALLALRPQLPETVRNMWPLESVDPCDNVALYRYTITCARPTQPHFPYRIVGFNLNCQNLEGTIPNFSNFTALLSVDLSNNKLNGTLELEKFGPNIQVINLWNNSLSGTLPNFGLASSKNISELYLSGNKFIGTIPTWGTTDGQDPLKVLSLSGNSLTGGIPDFFALGHNNLEQLFLSNMSLGGTIPDGLTSLSKLVILSLWRNNLTGTVPFFNTPTLRFLYLDRNSLTGTIPSFSSLSDMRILYLRENALTGEIPSELGSLLNMNALSLASNNLSGTIPSSFQNLVNISLLHLYLNPLLHGTIPNMFANMTKLRSLDLSSCSFSGNVPPSIESIFSNKKFAFLNLAWNVLEGNLSATFLANQPNVSSSAVVDIRNNIWTCGSLPSWCAPGIGNGMCDTIKCILAPPVTAAPGVITGGKRAVKSISLKWSPTSEMEANSSIMYEVQMTEFGKDEFTTVVTGSNPSATIDGLTAGRSYLFRIRAVGAGEEGPWSSPLHAFVD